MTEQIIKKLQQALSQEVEFALVFGSILTPYFREDSDVDVAVFLKRPPKSWRERAKYYTRLSEAIGREVDVIFLNTSDIIITMQVLANGRLIVNNNPRKFIRFKAQKLGEYPDFKMSRKIIEDNLLNGRIYA